MTFGANATNETNTTMAAENSTENPLGWVFNFRVCLLFGGEEKR